MSVNSDKISVKNFISKKKKKKVFKRLKKKSVPGMPTGVKLRLPSLKKKKKKERKAKQSKGKERKIDDISFKKKNIK